MTWRNLLITIVICAVGSFFFVRNVADLVDRPFADAEGTYTRVWWRTTDAAAGDEVAIRIEAEGGKAIAISRVVANLGGTSKVVLGSNADWAVVNKKGGGADELVFSLPVPADLPANAMLDLDLDLVIAQQVGSSQFETRAISDHVSMPVRLSSSPLVWKVIHVGVAVLAWIAAAAAAFAIARSRPRPKHAAPTISDELVAAGVGLALVVVAAIGHFAFVKMILRTTAVHGRVFHAGLYVTWMLAIALGAWRGIVQWRERIKWRAGRVRPVIGNHATGADAKLPPSLSRPAEARSPSDVRSAIEAAGFSVVASPRSLHALRDGVPALRISTKQPGPWRPEDLGVEVYNQADAAPIVRELSMIYGALEYQAPNGQTTIVEAR